MPAFSAAARERATPQTHPGLPAAASDTWPVDSVPDMRYARTSDGVTIAYQVFGQGPPVVWLPSLSNLLAQWRIPAMRQAYEALAR